MAKRKPNNPNASNAKMRATDEANAARWAWIAKNNPNSFAAKTAAASANPYVATGPPIDPMYEATKVSAGRNVALADSDALYQGAQIENQYGLGSDTSNPYSRAKLLENNYQRSQLGTTNNYASQGQLYSGAYERMQGENTRNYSMGYDQLARGYGDAKYQNTRAQLGTYASNATGVDQEKFNALLRALGGT